MGFDERKKGSAPKSKTDPQKEFDEVLHRFQAAFELIQVTNNESKRKYYFEVFDKELALLDNLAKNISRKGIRKQESILSRDARAYMLNQGAENFEKLKQDIVTLKEANQVSKDISL